MDGSHDNEATHQASDLKPLRIGVLGTARITRRLVPEMQATEGVLVTAIASRDASRAKWYAQQYGIQHAIEGYQSLIESDLIDAVYITLPPSLHKQWGVAAAEAGKHVLCEKPLVTSWAEFVELDEACRKHRVIWLDATAWLHHERTGAMRIALEHDLGTVKHITASVSFFEPFQTDDHRLDAMLGGGCLLDLGWYAAGLAVWVKGELPTVEGALGSQKNGTWSRCSALLRWGDGTTASLNCGYDMASRKWFEVAGDERSLICDDFTRPWPDRPPRFWIHDRSGSVTSVVKSGNQEIRMIERFRDVIRNPLSLKVWLRQAEMTQRVVDAWQAKLA